MSFLSLSFYSLSYLILATRAYSYFSFFFLNWSWDYNYFFRYWYYCFDLLLIYSCSLDTYFFNDSLSSFSFVSYFLRSNNYEESDCFSYESLLMTRWFYVNIFYFYCSSFCLYWSLFCFYCYNFSPFYFNELFSSYNFSVVSFNFRYFLLLFSYC